MRQYFLMKRDTESNVVNTPKMFPFWKHKQERRFLQTKDQCTSEMEDCGPEKRFRFKRPWDGSTPCWRIPEIPDISELVHASLDTPPDGL